ncbi:hypothetical protein M9458_018581, partial [Cirrhinus mrigala]
FTLLKSGTTRLLRPGRVGSSGATVSTLPAPLNLSIQEDPFSCGSSGPMGPSGTLCQPLLPPLPLPSPMPSPIMRATTAVSTRSRLESAHLSRGRVSLYPSLFE